MRKLLFILLLCSPWNVLGAGPKYHYEDSNLNDEMSNIYKDIPNVLKGDVRISSVTIASATVTSQLDMRSNKITNVANGTAATNAAAFGQIPVITAGQIVGTATNDSPTAGNVGEYVTSTVGAANAPTTGQYGDVTNIALTAGDWQVSGSVMFNINGATWSQGTAGISNTTGNSTIGLTNGDTLMINSWVLSAVSPTFVSVNVQPFRVLASGATTYYLKALSAYTGGPPTALGRISARRMR